MQHARIVSFLLVFLTPFLTLYVTAQSKGPGPRAGHCVLEHANTLYFLAGTPPISSSYAAFTSLRLPTSSLSTIDPETLPWVDLPNPPFPIHITNITMTYTSQSTGSTATPAWIDCFATDDGRIVVVGGSFQLLVYDIAAATWDAGLVSVFKYGPLVSSHMFLNPVYLQSRILADGFTALVVCTLTWNSQPQPYYLDTRTWTVTLAIGTPDTTPVVSGRSNGWGAIPGVTTLAPPAGFRHYTLAIMGQDKNEPKKHYNDGRAYLIGGYSTLVTGQVQDWAVVTSFPVQQAPSNVAFPISLQSMAVLPGNGGSKGGSSNVLQQAVQQYDAPSNGAATTAVDLPDVTGSGPRNTIFRGATIIGTQGGSQIIVHGGLTSLEMDPQQPLTNYLVGSMGVYNGDSMSWGDVVNTYTFEPKTSKGLTIGLSVGGSVLLLVLVGGGVWYYKRRQRIRETEEEDRRAKGMALKNEEMLHKDHRTSQQQFHHQDQHYRDQPQQQQSVADPSSAYRPVAEPGIYYEPIQLPQHHFESDSINGRNSTSVDWRRSAVHVDAISPIHQNSPQMSQVSDSTRVVHSPQEYPSYPLPPTTESSGQYQQQQPFVHSTGYHQQYHQGYGS
ncbi:hypothetical protein BGZ94_002509 [Podila epigama]|nr:hypothetical protein BGZ94_002509 [Podila epigama]